MGDFNVKRAQPKDRIQLVKNEQSGTLVNVVDGGTRCAR